MEQALASHAQAAPQRAARPSTKPSPPPPAAAARIQVGERDATAAVLARPGSTVREAARELGLSRATRYRRLGQYGLSRPS